MPKTVKTTYTAINLETGEVYTGIDAPQSITRGETHFWQASKDFFAALLGYGTVESKVVANLLHHTDPKTNRIACTLPELRKELSCTRDTVASAIKKMESKRLIIGIGQGVWMLNPRMLAMGNQTQIALLMAEYDRYVSEKTGVALVAGKYVLKNPVTAEELPLPPECDDKLMFLDGNVQFWKIYDAFFTAVAGLSENELRVLLHMMDINKSKGGGTYNRPLTVIADEARVSVPTVNRAVKKLKKRNLVIRYCNCNWMINPLMVANGNKRKQKVLERRYTGVQAENEAKLKRYRFRVLSLYNDGKPFIPVGLPTSPQKP